MELYCNMLGQGVIQEKGPISDEEASALDYDLLTPGYLRSEGCLDGNAPHTNIVNLCTEFANPVMFKNEADDPINFISDQDKEHSDRYKKEGNVYFKSKEYDEAVAKYTTAIRMFSNLDIVLIYSQSQTLLNHT